MVSSPARGFFSITNPPSEGMEFVTRKITHGLARIQFGLQEKLVLGNLNSRKGLGIRPGVCGGHVANAATGSTR